MIADATVLDLALPLDCDDGPSTRVSNDLNTETIIEEFIQFKLKKQGKLLQRRSGPSDIETQVLVGRLIEISNELEVRYGEQLNQDAQLWIQSASFESFVQIAKGPISDTEQNPVKFAVLRDYGPGSSTGGLLVFAGLLVVAVFFAVKAT
ncbi:unnamed protein product [Calicophoron daubneyi]|uniref:Uncharacterized protein n=1 Tax=Calicophoron daubneyi TaxID=300641 RepID=A0AAV2TST2_CALDB